jgi:hypothetical protein
MAFRGASTATGLAAWPPSFEADSRRVSLVSMLDHRRKPFLQKGALCQAACKHRDRRRNVVLFDPF